MRYIDLHAHLDGSITVPIAKKLAKMQSIPLPDDEQLKNLIVAPENCKSLNDFLKCFSFPLSLLQTEKSVSEAVNLVLCEMQNEDVVYAEIMFAPQLHTQNGISQENIVLSAIEGLKKHQYARIFCFALCAETKTRAKTAKRSVLQKSILCETAESQA